MSISFNNPLTCTWPILKFKKKSHFMNFFLSPYISLSQ